MLARVSGSVCSFLLVCVLLSCTVHDVPLSQTFNQRDAWVILPIKNYSAEPLAGEKAIAILDTLLRSRGFNHLSHVPNLESSSSMPELDERKRLNQALKWAKEKKFRYGFSASISEWRYKSGLDAEPAVGMSLQVIEVATGEIIWSSSSARSGWGRESLTGNAQKVMRELVGSINLGEL